MPSGVAAAAFLLLFIGIHTAWDAVTYLVFVRWPQHEKDPPPEPQRWLSDLAERSPEDALI
jgi:hypothetical protein